MVTGIVDADVLDGDTLGCKDNGYSGDGTYLIRNINREAVIRCKGSLIL